MITATSSGAGLEGHACSIVASPAQRSSLGDVERGRRVLDAGHVRRRRFRNDDPRGTRVLEHVRQVVRAVEDVRRHDDDAEAQPRQVRVDEADAVLDVEREPIASPPAGPVSFVATQQRRRAARRTSPRHKRGKSGDGQRAVEKVEPGHALRVRCSRRKRLLRDRRRSRHDNGAGRNHPDRAARERLLDHVRTAPRSEKP